MTIKNLEDEKKAQVLFNEDEEEKTLKRQDSNTTEKNK